MSNSKSFIFILMIAFLIQSVLAEKRVKPKTIEELTNTASPSFVPFPYPESQAEIIADIEYAFKKFNAEGKSEIFLKNKIPPAKQFELDFSNENSNYKIGKITKVKNISPGFSEDYYWLVIVLNKNNSIAARIVVHANGLWGQTSFYSSEVKPQFIMSDQDVVSKLVQATGKNIEKKDIKKIERIAFPSVLGYLLMPTWEITLKDKSIYYYSFSKDAVYCIDKRIPWTKDNKGNRPDWRQLVPNMNFALNEIDDTIILFKKVKSKGKKD